MDTATLIQGIDTITAILSHAASAAGFVIFGTRWLYLELEHRRLRRQLPSR